MACQIEHLSEQVASPKYSVNLAAAFMGVRPATDPSLEQLQELVLQSQSCEWPVKTIATGASPLEVALTVIVVAWWENHVQS